MFSRARLPCVALVLLPLLGAGRLPAQSPGLEPALTLRIDSLFARFSRPGQPGCALGVVRDGRLALAKGYGLASVELGVPITATTVFDIGSVSKQFTAMSIVLLARDGRLSLDDEIQKYLPEIPRYARPVTIRHLLHHTSGLRDYIDLLELSGIQEESVTGEREALAILARQRAPNFEAGAEYAYSNTGFFLLSVIVKRVTGASLREFAARRIFEPLGMSHTRYVESHTEVVAGKASSYGSAIQTGLRAAPANWEQIGDGAVNTTVEDLAKWDANFTSGAVGGAAAIRELETVGVLNDGTSTTYALGLGVDTWRGLRRVSHGGSWAGFRAQLTQFPEQRLTVACLCNVSNALPSLLVERVSELLLGDRLTGSAPAFTPFPGVRPGKPPRPLGDYVGRYHSDELFADWDIGLQDDTLRLRIGPLVEEALTPSADGSFGGIAKLRFTERDGRVTGIVVDTRGARQFTLSRMETPP